MPTPLRAGPKAVPAGHTKNVNAAADTALKQTNIEWLHGVGKSQRGFHRLDKPAAVRAATL